MRNCLKIRGLLSCLKVKIVYGMPYNGPAIKCRLCWFANGSCEQEFWIGVESWYTAVMNKPWRVFLPSRYKVIWGLRVSRYKVYRSRELIPGYRVGGVHRRSDRGTNYLEARNLSWCRILFACRCGSPGARAITNLSSEQEQKQKPWQTTYLYGPCYV